MKMFTLRPRDTPAQSGSRLWQAATFSFQHTVLLLVTACQVMKLRETPSWQRTQAMVCLMWQGLWETRLTLKWWLSPHKFPLPFLFALYILSPNGEVQTREVQRSSVSPLSSRHSLEHLWLTRVFHFFPTPLVTFDLECRFLLLEEWLSLLPECLGGLSSEPGQRNRNTPSPWAVELPGLTPVIYSSAFQFCPGPPAKNRLFPDTRSPSSGLNKLRPGTETGHWMSTAGDM